MRARLAAVVAAAVLTGLAVPGHAAPAPQITDAKGDVVVPEASLDIVSALFSTTGIKLGKKYKPTKLVVTVTYAAAPNTSELGSQAVLFALPGCGEMLMQRYSGGTYGNSGCSADAFDFSVAVKGNTVTFTAPFGVLGSKMKPGVVLSNLRTWTGGADPVVGFGPADFSEDLVADTASTTKTYKVA